MFPSQGNQGDSSDFGNDGANFVNSGHVISGQSSGSNHFYAGSPIPTQDDSSAGGINVTAGSGSVMMSTGLPTGFNTGSSSPTMMKPTAISPISSSTNNAHPYNMGSRIEGNRDNQLSEPSSPLKQTSIQLPITRVKRIMREDPALEKVSSEFVTSVSACCEIFLGYLVKHAYQYTKRDKRKTVSYKDLLLTVKEVDQFVFLDDVVPELLPVKKATEIRDGGVDKPAESEESNAENESEGTQEYKESTEPPATEKAEPPSIATNEADSSLAKESTN